MSIKSKLYPQSRTGIFSGGFSKTGKSSKFTIDLSTRNKPSLTWWGGLPWNLAEAELFCSPVSHKSPAQAACGSEISTNRNRNFTDVVLGMTLAAGVSASFWTGFAFLLSKILG
jgi:hypothetical protein